MATCDTLIRNVTLLDKTGLTVAHQAIAIYAGKIAWVGADQDLPKDLIANSTKNGKGQLITPGLIDCHTHLVYAGNRANEFKARMQGATYADIALAGGGILSTVEKTRAASEEALIEQSLPRILALKEEGVSTVEIKSGYGLDLKNESKMLKVARKIGELAGIRVKTTFLGAHAIPPEYKGNNQKYVDMLCNEMLPIIAESKLADAVDVFCEKIGFTLAQTEQIFTASKTLGFNLKCHAGQLSEMGACQLAAHFGALSCDHLEYLDKKGVQAMANANMVAVLLPGAWYFLKEKQSPPIALLREMGVGMALATDCNPGSSPTTSLLLMMNMACQFFGFTVPEALSAVTWQAARALGIEKETGSLEVGKAADLIHWSLDESDSLCYYFGYPIKRRLMIAGVWQ